jgi:hypothetical protein
MLTICKQTISWPLNSIGLLSCIASLKQSDWSIHPWLTRSYDPVCDSTYIKTEELFTLCLSLFLKHRFLFILVLLLCCVYRWSLYCNIPSDMYTLYYSVCVMLLLQHHFIVILVLLLCCVSRSSLQIYVLCWSCYYFYIVLFLYLYCCYVVYPDHHFTVISLQTCVFCVCLDITSILFYLYACIVAMWCI